jgi:hypothetical protein
VKNRQLSSGTASWSLGAGQTDPGWRQRWPQIYDRYLVALRERLPMSQAPWEFVDTLRLHEDYAEAIIAQALGGECLQQC